MPTFKETGLGPELLKAIEELGFETPTPIQQQALPHLLSADGDLVALAQTGTGKTAAFCLPVLQQIDLNSNITQALILSPTRELAMQITRDIESYSKYLPKFRVLAVYGGTNIQTQISALKRGVQIVVGTPGRALDLIRRKMLKLSNISWLVLDEADEMLSMGFKDDLDAILAATPRDRKTLLFSATMPREVSRIAKEYMTAPMELSVGKRNAGADNVKHIYVMAHARDRYRALRRIADVHPNIYGIVFCRTRRETKDVADKLMADGYNADALHGDLSQSQRDYVMNRFRTKHLQILVATDVAARGLDVNDLTHVINYNLPDELEAYIHRSGRTGRAGKKGTSIVIIHTREMHRIRALEKKVGKKFERKPVPSGRQICEKQLFHLVDKVEKVKVNEKEIESFLPVVIKKLEWLSREDLIKHFLSMEFNRFLSYYGNAPDLNVATSKKREPRDSRGSRSKTSSRQNDEPSAKGKGRYARFYINIGSKNRLNPTGLIQLINEQPKLQKVSIGNIDIKKNFTIFEFDSGYERELMAVFSKVKFDNVKLFIKPVAAGDNRYSSKISSKRKKGFRKRF